MRKMRESLWNRARCLLGLIAVCAMPFFIVGLLFADELSFWRMALAYAIAVCSRQGFKLAFNGRRKVWPIVAACLLLPIAIICAAFVAWRPEHWAVCGCGQPLDYIVPAQFYPGPIVSAGILIIASLWREHDAFRGLGAKILFYAACMVMAWFALNFAEQ